MRIALVDLCGVYWTAWHANPDGEVTAAYNVTKQRVHDLVQRYDSVAICLDSPTSWRRDDYPEYKANREPKPAGAIELLRRVEDELRGMCHVLGADGYEADDVIATAAHWVQVTGHEAFIISSDKDLRQCLGHRVKQIHLNGDLLTADDIGIRPAQVPTWLALIGDKSDNLPGVPGVGDKTARRMLEKYATLEGIVDAALAGAEGFRTKSGELTAVAKAIAAAEDAQPSLYDVRELATCKTDVPIDCSVLEIPTKPTEENMSDIDEAEVSEPPPPPPSSDERASQPEPSQPRTLAVRHVDFNHALEPMSQKEAWQLAGAAFQSGLFKGLRNREAVFMAIVAGRSYGLDSVQSLTGIHVIEGKPTLSAGLIHALCLRHPSCEYFQMTESTDTSATFETKRVGAPTPVRYSFTMTDAKRAGLTGKQNWEKYPKAMLRARCVAELARAVYPDAVHNTYLPDELGADVAEVA